MVVRGHLRQVVGGNAIAAMCNWPPEWIDAHLDARKSDGADWRLRNGQVRGERTGMNRQGEHVSPRIWRMYGGRGSLKRSSDGGHGIGTLVYYKFSWLSRAKVCQVRKKRIPATAGRLRTKDESEQIARRGDLRRGNTDFRHSRRRSLTLRASL